MRLSDILGKLGSHPARWVAVVGKDGTATKKTHAELAADVGALAARLSSANLSSGTRVGLLGANSYSWIVWDLAALSLGLISVALPEEFAARGARALIERYGLALLATDDARLLGPAVVPLTHVTGELPSDEAAWGAAVKSGPADQPDDCLSMVFSSGTTGRLKGLYISLSRVEGVVERYAEAFPPAADDRHLIFIPFSNFQQRLAYYGCLFHGLDVAVVTSERLFVGLAQFAPTFLIGPPMLYESLRMAADQGGGVAATRARLMTILGGKMRYMITGMAPIKRSTLEFYAAHDVALYEAYGCTEAGMIAWNKPGMNKLGTVGKPVQLGCVRLAEDGEVLVVGQSPVSLGYFDVPAHEAEKVFVSDNIVATGDRGSFDEDGYLRLHGRIQDSIVLADGRKLHPESIEALLEAHPSILTAVVFARETSGLAAVLHVREANDDARRALQEHVQRVNAATDALRKVEDVRFTEQAFGAENGMRTTNLKLNRRAIRQHFAL